MSVHIVKCIAILTHFKTTQILLNYYKITEIVILYLNNQFRQNLLFCYRKCFHEHINNKYTGQKIINNNLIKFLIELSPSVLINANF